MRKLTECVPELATASHELDELEVSIRKMGGSDTLKEWRGEVEAWEEDEKNPNPFESRAKEKTVVDVRLEMADEVENEMDAQMDVDSEEADEAARDMMHATEMIGMGLQLEELQYVSIALLSTPG